MLYKIEINFVFPFIISMFLMGCGNWKDPQNPGPPPLCKTETACMDYFIEVNGSIPSDPECVIDVGHGPKKQSWIVTADANARAPIAFGYDERIRYWDHSGSTINKTVIVSPGQTVFLGCRWKGWSNRDTRERVERLIYPKNRCFTDRTNCGNGIQLPTTQPRTPDLAQSCKSSCLSSDNTRCPNLGDTMPKETVDALSLLATDALYAALPKQVDMNPILKMVGSPDCDQRKWPTLRPATRDTGNSSFEFVGTACQKQYDERPFNIPVAGTPYIYDQLWLNVPLYIQGTFVRKVETPRDPQDAPRIVSATFNFDKNNTVYARATFAQPGQTIPPEMRSGEDRLLSVEVNVEERGRDLLIMQGEAFICGRVDLNLGFD